jgi:flagellar hook-associated protein 1
MGLTQALGTSLAGLSVTQAGLSVVAGNIANAQTPGYVAQSAVQIESSGGGDGEGVRVASINRMLDQFVQQQLRTESSGGAYADIRANFYQQLQQVYGQPGSGTALDDVFNTFTSAVQTLSTSPNSIAAQTQTVSAAQALAQQLNNATATIQSLRGEADQGIASDVQEANNALTQIATINGQLASANAADSTAASLEDQRDQYIDQLSKLMDIRVVQGGNNQVSVFTNSGAQLVGNQASQLNFTATGTMTASEQWNADPTKSTLGTITLVSPNGGTSDLLANGGIRSGEIAGYLNMRDNVLVQAQSQIDDFAAQMSKSLSDTSTPGSAVTVGVQSGFDADLTGLQNGSAVQVSYTDASNVQHNVTMNVDFSGGAGSVVTQLNNAFGSVGLQFSNPSGNTLEVLNASAGVTVNGMATTQTQTSLTGGSGALPLFTDGSSAFTGAFTSSGSETTGYAGRITVNAALVGDPSALVDYQTSTSAGDSTRPNFIYNQLVNAALQYSPTTGIGTAASPFQGTLTSYLSQVVTVQSQATTAATNLQSGQDVVVNALQTRFNATSAVNIDTEMANLLSLQNAYGANARVMSTVKQMLDTLMQM